MSQNRPESPIKTGDFPVRIDSVEGRVYSFPLYYHSEWEITLISHGRCWYFIRDKVYEITAGSIAIISGNTLHNRMENPDSLEDPNSNAKRTTLIFHPVILSGNNIAQELLERLKSYNQLTLHGKVATQVEIMMSDILDECHSRNSSWQEVVTGLIVRLLAVLDRVGVHGSVDAKRENPVIREVIRYVDANYSTPLTLMDVSEQVCLHPNSLSRAFKSYVGVGFKEYVIQKRVLEAKKLLEHRDDMKIASVAFNVGFENLSAFNRDFRIVTGMSPSAYRKCVGKAEKTG